MSKIVSAFMRWHNEVRVSFGWALRRKQRIEGVKRDIVFLGFSDFRTADVHAHADVEVT
jgi:hypothetical protein